MIVLVVCLVVGEVVDQVVKSSTAVGQRTDKTWVAAVATIVDESNTLSPALHAIRAHATDPAVFDRVTLEYALAELARSAESDANTYRELGLAAPSQRADALDGRGSQPAPRRRREPRARYRARHLASGRAIVAAAGGSAPGDRRVALPRGGRGLSRARRRARQGRERAPASVLGLDRVARRVVRGGGPRLGE